MAGLKFDCYEANIENIHDITDLYNWACAHGVENFKVVVQTDGPLFELCDITVYEDDIIVLGA